MEVEYTLSENDYVAFNLYYARHDPAFVRRVRVMQAAGAAALLILGAVVCILRGGVNGGGMLLFAIAAAVFVPFVSHQARSAVEKRVRLTVESTPDIPQGCRRIRLSGDALVICDKSGDQKIPFVDIDRTVRTKTHLFLMTGMREVVVIPLAAFETPDDAQQFYSALPNTRTAEG